ncbi:MAG TPA: tyrosinase family protein, partial [Capillimicrobium sp.]|nr:tyrosinase family protein [Capillimicrobium sp.]
GDEVDADCEWVSTRDAAGLVRKDAAALTAEERRDLVEAMHELKRIPSPYDAKLPWYDQFVAWHDEAFDGNPSAHESAAFLPWHRQFLAQFEAALQTAAGKPIALPYWDWTNPASTAAVFSDELMGPAGDAADGYAVTRGPFRKGAWRLWARDDGDPSPFVVDGEPQPAEGRYIERAVGQTSYGRLPTTDDVAAMLSNRAYDASPWNGRVRWGRSFRNGVEGWGSPRASHNTVHVWVGGEFVGRDGEQMGTMALGTSPNDPVFWLHHANIDRLWSTWSAANGRVYLPAQGGPTGVNRGDTMEPFARIGIAVTPGDLLSTRPLGYRYDTDGDVSGGRRTVAGPARDLHEVAADGGLLCVL